MRELGLAAAEFAEYFADAHALEAAEIVSDGATIKRREVYPPRIESNCLLPVEILMTLFRWRLSSIAVMKPEPDGCRISLDPIIYIMGCAYQTFIDSLLDFLNLDFTEALDFQQGLPSRSVDGLDGWSKHEDIREGMRYIRLS